MTPDPLVGGEVRPYYADDWLTVYHGDARTVMAEMDPESVHCVVTSPPYWGLRDYGEPGQLGLEATPEAYVASLVDVFREVRRVLRSDGTVWLNLGDSYAAGGGSDVQRLDELGVRLGTGGGKKHSSRPSGRAPLAGLKPKDLVGIPWMVAFALRADGWYLRSDIIWSKPNPMPESVTDRPTKSHEYLFLLSKSARYYFDADAVREEPAGEFLSTGVKNPRYGRPGGTMPYEAAGRRNGNPSGAVRGLSATAFKAGIPDGGRNLRSVWTVATQPYPGAHFATFPPKLIEPCIKAGTSERGVCPECGAPWAREVERGEGDAYTKDFRADGRPDDEERAARNFRKIGGGQKEWDSYRPPKTTGWRPSCDHWPKDFTPQPWPVPATVLDPFAGSGTTGMVAQSLSRRAVLIDLSMDYLGQLMDRNRAIPLGLGA